MATVNWPIVRIRIERFLIGSGMSGLAWFLERAVIRSTKRSRGK